MRPNRKEDDMNALVPAAVAALLGKGERWFRRQWRDLVKRHGFPAPLPGIGLRWSEPQVAAWIAAGGVPVPVEMQQQPTVVEAARQSLEARYAA
jgi:hypothetical protein